MLKRKGEPMTEAEWLACENNPSMMFEALGPIRTERKSRLLAVACFRRTWTFLDDERSRRLVEIVERYVDGLASADEWTAATAEAVQAERDATDRAMQLFNSVDRDFRAEADASARRSWLFGAAHGLSRVRNAKPDEWKQQTLTVFRHTTSENAKPRYATELEYKLELLAQCVLLRDIFGSPFRSIPFRRRWRTDTALILARQMYDARDFSAMPILADALQDAGCDNDEILSHCRSNGPHVHGCWVVDLVLGKE
jgi:hypothetical protein